MQCDVEYWQLSLFLLLEECIYNMAVFHSNLLSLNLGTLYSGMGAISFCLQKYLILISLCLFAGWGEHHGKQGWLQAGEDMCGCSRKAARYEIVRKIYLKRLQE
jgi:hypothetical protein